MGKKQTRRRPSSAEPQRRTHTLVSRRTLRLTFAYEGARIELVSQVRVEKITPPSLTPCPDQNSSGYWVELQDARGKCLFHRPLPDAIKDTAEIYPQGKPLTRVALREIKGQFEVLLPDLADGARVVVMGHPIAAKGLLRHEPCQALAQFDLRGEGKEGQS